MPSGKALSTTVYGAVAAHLDLHGLRCGGLLRDQQGPRAPTYLGAVTVPEQALTRRVGAVARTGRYGGTVAR